MATSSIFRNVVLKSAEDVISFVDALERSRQDAVPEVSVDVEYIEGEQNLNAFLDGVRIPSK